MLVATKTQRFDAAGARKELETSLKRLRTDRIDIWQFHALRSDGDTKRILGKNGALAAAKKAQEEGKVRFVGITGHYDPQVFVAALDEFAFDTLLIPLNCIDPHHRAFETSAFPHARKKKAGVVAMKVFCSGRLPGRRHRVRHRLPALHAGPSDLDLHRWLPHDPRDRPRRARRTEPQATHERRAREATREDEAAQPGPRVVQALTSARLDAT